LVVLLAINAEYVEKIIIFMSIYCNVVCVSVVHLQHFIRPLKETLSPQQHQTIFMHIEVHQAYVQGPYRALKVLKNLEFDGTKFNALKSLHF